MRRRGMTMKGGRQEFVWSVKKGRSSLLPQVERDGLKSPVTSPGHQQTHLVEWYPNQPCYLLDKDPAELLCLELAETELLYRMEDRNHQDPEWLPAKIHVPPALHVHAHVRLFIVHVHVHVHPYTTLVYFQPLIYQQFDTACTTPVYTCTLYIIHVCIEWYYWLVQCTPPHLGPLPAHTRRKRVRSCAISVIREPSGMFLWT